VSQSDLWQTLRVVPRDSCSLTVHGLRSRTRYQFVVLARDQHGASHFSRLVSAMTTSLSRQLTNVADDRPQFTSLGQPAITCCCHDNLYSRRKQTKQCKKAVRQQRKQNGKNSEKKQSNSGCPVFVGRTFTHRRSSFSSRRLISGEWAVRAHRNHFSTGGQGQKSSFIM